MTVHRDAGVVLPGDGRVFWTGRTEAQVKIEAAEDRSFVVFEASPPPGVPGPPQHVHCDYDEAWYILGGQVEFDLGTDTYLCPTGSLVFAPRGTAHCFRNRGPAIARMLVLASPPILTLVADLGRLTGGDGPPDMAAVEALLAQHRTVNVAAP
jgi:mannose-6-phosphate isomerase-like protein (cupin superfamily)